MPAIFPELLPDELLYSAIARYQEMMCFSSRAVLRNVFGSAGRAYALIDLPTGIETFVERLPPGHAYQPVAVIRDHTTLPYYIPFHSAERIEHATAVMLGRRSGQVPHTLGIWASTVKAPTHLNYCEACRVADREEFGTAYWHRVHQLPGVFVCPEHALPLRRSPFERASHTSRRVLHALEHLPTSGAAEVLSSIAADPMHLEQIAEDSRWLLVTCVGPHGADALRDRHRSLASAAGFLSKGGKVRIDKLRTALIAHYGQPFLEEIGCNLVPRAPTDWLGRLLRSLTKTVHPLQHILVARFLGSPIRNVLHHDSQTDAGLGDRIQIVRIARPQTSSGRRQHLDPTREWDEKLKAMVVDSSKVLAAIAAELGVAPLTVKRHAHRLGVWRTEWKLSERILPGIARTNRRQRLREERQRSWLALRAANPTLGLKQLAAIRHKVYQWLRRNESVWLDAHSPPKRVRQQPLRYASKVNWAERDEQALQAARSAVREFLTNPSGARRVTLASVGHKIGLQTQLQKQVDRLPRTIAYLRRAVQFQYRLERRRLYHAVMGHLIERTIPSPIHLASHASLGKSLRRGLRDMATAAVGALRRSLGFNEPFSMNWSDPVSPKGQHAKETYRDTTIHPRAPERAFSPPISETAQSNGDMTSPA